MKQPSLTFAALRDRFLIICCAFVIFFVFSLSAAHAAVVNCLANRPGAGNVIYLYYPTSSDSNFCPSGMMKLPRPWRLLPEALDIPTPSAMTIHQP